MPIDIINWNDFIIEYTFSLEVTINEELFHGDESDVKALFHHSIWLEEHVAVSAWEGHLLLVLWVLASDSADSLFAQVLVFVIIHLCDV